MDFLLADTFADCLTRLTTREQKAVKASVLDLAGHLPQEAAEALLELATGNEPQPAKSTDDGLAHPDAQRRFRLIKDEKELELAMKYPWEKRTVFLHPSRRVYAEKSYNGPARITGSAGTGKTIAALTAVSLESDFLADLS